FGDTTVTESKDLTREDHIQLTIAKAGLD
ncbi:hypothetical protein AVEN_213443-2-2, partial [Araneus ventricosus]